jgi:ATP-dependent helicase STH1/SNF2
MIMVKTKRDNEPSYQDSPAISNKRSKKAPRENEPFNQEMAYTHEQIFSMGLQVLNSIKMYQDKQKRLLAAPFYILPTKRDYPKYYKIIKQPIDLKSIEEKLNQKDYTELEGLVDDLKLVFHNAKEYNDELSQIYKDAQILEQYVLECLEHAKAQIALKKRDKTVTERNLQSLQAALYEIHSRILGATNRQYVFG